ncbi:hypothetical protein DSUL_140053 [Desulfovibrionales bacterium]
MSLPLDQFIIAKNGLFKKKLLLNTDILEVTNLVTVLKKITLPHCGNAQHQAHCCREYISLPP